MYSVERKVAIFASLYLYPWSTSFHKKFELPGKSLNEMQHLTSGLLLKELIWRHNSASSVKWDKFEDIKKHPLCHLKTITVPSFVWRNKWWESVQVALLINWAFLWEKKEILTPAMSFKQSLHTLSWRHSKLYKRTYK